MAFISGLASGIDTETLIQQMLEIERRPAVLLQQEKGILQQKYDAYRDVNTRLNNLASRLSDLILSTAFGSKSVGSTNAGVATGTATTSGATGSYDITVAQLARAQSIASDTFADSTADLGLSGAVQINGVGVEITADMSLSEIKTAINSADAGVRATVLNNRLVLESETAGFSNAIQLIDSGDALEIEAESDDDLVVRVSADNTAQAGNYNVVVTQLASSHQVQGSDQGSSASSLGISGTFQLNGVMIAVGVGDTLENIRDKINSSGAGVQASITANNELVLTSEVSGSIGRISALDDSGMVLEQLGVIQDGGTFVNETVAADDAKFSVDGDTYIRHTNVITDGIAGLTLTLESVGNANVTVTRSGGGGVLADLGLLDANGLIKTELQSAQDAVFSINGIDFTRDSNRVSDAVTGLTLTLSSMGNATITVERDVDRAVQSIQAFVDQYNSTQSFLAEKTAKEALLQGDATLTRLAAQIQLRATDRAGVPADFAYDSLSVIGISVDKFGVMSVDTTKLAEALNERPDEVEKLFNAKTSVDGYDGVAVRLRDYLDTYTRSGTGVITTRQQLFDEQMDTIQDSIDRLNQRLQIREQSLIRRFTEMERVLATIQSLGVTLSGHINQLTGFRNPND